MERIKPNKTVSAILCSDIHLRDDVPICRTDNYWETQWKKVDFISDLQKKYNCLVLHGGDLFDKPKPSNYLLRETILHIPNMFYGIYGQHDLPNHALSLTDKCGMDVLKAGKHIHVFENGCHWGQTPKLPSLSVPPNRDILVWHHMTYLVTPFPGAEGGMAEGLLRKYPDFSLILCGDNHQSFSIQYQGRLLVNPGSMMRMDADQADFQPRVALWFAEDNSIEWVNLPIQKDVISQDHLILQKERDSRIDAFMSSLNGDYKTEMSFEQNLTHFFEVNPVRDSVKQIIYQSLE